MSKQPHNNLNIFRWHLIDYFDITKVQFRAVDESHIDLNLKGFGVESNLTMSYKASKYLTFSFNTLRYHIFLFNLSFQLFTSTIRRFPNLIFFFVISFLRFVWGTAATLQTRFLHKTQLYFVFSRLQNLQSICYTFYLNLDLLPYFI